MFAHGFMSRLGSLVLDGPDWLLISGLQAEGLIVDGEIFPFLGQFPGTAVPLTDFPHIAKSLLAN